MAALNGSCISADPLSDQGASQRLSVMVVVHVIDLDVVHSMIVPYSVHCDSYLCTLFIHLIFERE